MSSGDLLPIEAETTLSRAATNSPSLRTTVPEWLVQFWGAEMGDKIRWKLEGSSVSVEPIKKSGKKASKGGSKRRRSK